MRVYLDTNIIIDAFAAREPWRKDAENIIRLASLDQLEIVLSSSALTDIYYICNKVLNDKKRTREIIKQILTLFIIADVKKNDIIEALNLEVADLEDALVATCSKRMKAQYIVTRNVKDFEKSSVTAIKPHDFINQFFSKKEK